MLTPTPYQREIATAAVRSILSERGSVFTVEMPLGSGVRELSSQLELLVMSVSVHSGEGLLRVAPSASSSVKDRLVAHLREGALQGLWSAEEEDVRLGRSQVRYVLPEQVADAEGPICLIQAVDAHLLPQAAFDRILAVGEASGATVVLYGRPWSGETPFERLKERHKLAQPLDGERRHFRVPLERAEVDLPGYGARAAAARADLGAAHPEFAAAYELRPTSDGRRAFAPEDLRALLAAGAPRGRSSGGALAASVVLTRLPEPGGGALGPASATAVVTIAERADGGVRVIDHRWVEAADAPALAKATARAVGKTWPCERVLVRDRTGGPADQVRHLLDRELGARRVRWMGERERSCGVEGSGLLASVLTGRLSLYAMDGSAEYRALRRELEGAVLRLGEGRGLSVSVPGSDEGFLEGLQMLTHSPRRRAESALERGAALPAALAS